MIASYFFSGHTKLDLVDPNFSMVSNYLPHFKWP